jgi:hypothetical protein
MNERFGKGIDGFQEPIDGFGEAIVDMRAYERSLQGSHQYVDGRDAAAVAS